MEEKREMENGKTTETGAVKTGLAQPGQFGQQTGSDYGQQSGSSFGQQAEKYGQKISEAASQAKDFVSDKVSVVGDKIKDLQNVDVKQFADNATEYARKNPGQAILISAAAGLVLGLLLRGSRR